MFRTHFRVRQEFNEEIQTSIYYIKDELQISIENNIFHKTRKKNHFGCMVMDWNIAHYESYGKTYKKLT